MCSSSFHNTFTLTLGVLYPGVKLLYGEKGGFYLYNVVYAFLNSGWQFNYVINHFWQGGTAPYFPKIVYIFCDQS